jgi:acyl-CoA thioesterase-1
MPIRSIVIFLFVFIVAGNAQAASILVWGDSLSAGYGLKPKEDWPTLLQTRLKQKGFRHTVINGSVSGETSAGGLSRLPSAIKRHKPNLVILELGANDGLRGLQPRLMANNLDEMIRLVRSSGARVLLVGMELPPNYGHAYTRRFQQSFADVANQAKVPFVPFLLDGFADQREMFQRDGIHPTAEAQERIVDNIWKQLAPMLGS